MNRRWILRSVIGLVLAVAIAFSALVGAVLYANWSAERSAREFCSMIPIGSDISAATTVATSKGIHWGSYGGYTFYFPGFIFDKAVCEVSTSKEGKVISRRSEMEYD
jgi:hypothetical protein